MVDWVEAMYFQLVDRVADVVHASDVKVYEYDPVDEDWDEVGSNTWDDFFNGATDMFPHGVAAVVHAKTTDPDVQATKYLAGLTENQALDSDLIANAVTDLALFCDLWTTARVGAATGGDITPGVWSVAQGQFRGFLGGYVVNSLLGYQRRRKPGVGA
jgi:hypothetical protein